jgi:hypothetical protein
MNCNNCGKPLPPGVAFCPSCNAATPYNTTGQNPASSYDPTVAASSYGNPPSAPGPDQASPYGSSPNNYPPQSPYTAYGVPGGTPQASSYGSNTPPYDQGAQQPYGSTPQNFYTPPPQSGPAPYGYGTPSTPGMPPGGFGTGVPPKKRSKVGLIVGISLLVFVLLCGGLIALFAVIGRNAASSVNSVATSVASTTASTPTVSTPAVTPASGVPTTNDVIPAASKIIFNPQTSSAINSNYEPTKVATTFAPNKDMYLTFQEDSQGKDGYIQVKWYVNGTLADSRILKHNGQYDHGYFSHMFTDAGPVEAAMYWCLQATCSDAQLAQIVNFTVSNSAAVPSSNTGIVGVIGDNRRTS